jgi:hypothetical protein
MEKVVYLLGAGFSAPLGLPVVSNFLELSKDMFANEPAKYQHFRPIFTTIRDLSVIKTIYHTDLTNIEDILSIIEMEDGMSHSLAPQSFTQYIRDVIAHYTPDVSPPTEGGSFLATVCSRDDAWNVYGYFVLCLLGHSFTKIAGRKHTNSIEYDPLRPPGIPFEYSVVSLNYDLVLEKAAECINRNCGTSRVFSRSGNDKPEGAFLAKLHGSIDTGRIVPPTWNKAVAAPETITNWRLAHSLLSEANHIRVIGYSLPVADSYVKYLLRAAAQHCEHLKTFDVLCWDPDGSVETRYRDFVALKKLRFVSAKTEDYLRYLRDTHDQRCSTWPATFEPTHLEKAHSDFIDREFQKALERRLYRLREPRP